MAKDKTGASGPRRSTTGKNDSAPVRSGPAGAKVKPAVDARRNSPPTAKQAEPVSAPSPAEAEAHLQALTVAQTGAKAETPTLADALPPVSEHQPDTQLTIAQLKDKIMADTPNTNNFNKAADEATSTAANAMSEMQNRSRAAIEKSTEAMGEATDFAKGNVEAMVESSKIIATGLQELGRNYSEEARTAYEQMTADMREMAAIKSPTELFQLQSKIMRRNFDSLVSASSKNTESMMKLATDAFQPLSGRMNVAAEKATKIS